MSIIATITSKALPTEEIFRAVDDLGSQGHTPVLVGRSPGRIQSADGRRTEKVDVVPEAVNVGMFHGMMVPCDATSLDDFMRRFWATGRPVAAVSSGLASVLRAGIARGRTVASKPQMRLEACEAGASWLDARVLVDRGLITAPDGRDMARACLALGSRIG